MKDVTYFENIREAQEYLNYKKFTASIMIPRQYKVIVDVLAGETAQEQIQISSEGDFICEGFIAEFDFDSSGLPNMLVQITDTSNGSRSITEGFVPLSTIASIGKTGNQLILPLPFEHYFKGTGSIDFDFDNQSNLDSKVKITMVGYQF